MRCHYQARLLFFLSFMLCVGLLAFASFLQVSRHIEPCPLCILQRIGFFIIAAIVLVASLHRCGRLATRIYASLVAVFAILGALLAGRQVWLQHLPPDQIAGCGPSLGVMLKNFPISQTIKILLTGTAECAKVQWTFLHLSIAGWSLVAFIGFICFAMMQWCLAK